MAKVKALEMAGNMFVYENPRCNCKVGIAYTTSGEKEHTFWIKRIDGSYKYAYAPIDGLVMIDPETGSTIDTKVIEDFLNIEVRNIDSITEFIEKHGFFMPLPNDNEYHEYTHIDICNLINRFRCLIELMSRLEDRELNYYKILNLILPLMFKKAIVFENKIPKYASIHNFTELWQNASQLPDLVSNMIGEIQLDPYEVFYPVHDSFTNRTEKLNYIDYVENVEAIDTNTSNRFIVFKARVYKLYRDGFTEYTDTTSRYFIDFLYHAIKDGILNSDSYHAANTTFDFDDEHKAKLIEISKLVIKKELDYHLKGISPAYDIATMSPNWEIPDFYNAIYFSIFYTRPDFEVYRRCANPDCNCLFKVRTTNRHKKFHDDSCQIACSRRKNRK